MATINGIYVIPLLQQKPNIKTSNNALANLLASKKESYFKMLLTLFFHAFIIGFMVFFASIVAQSAFKTLSERAVGAFLRVLFPRMFVFGGVFSIFAILASIFEKNSLSLWISLAISLGFWINAFAITPVINKYRDQVLAGDEHANNKFKLFHLVSVSVFVSQLIGSSFVVLSQYF